MTSDHAEDLGVRVRDRLGSNGDKYIVAISQHTSLLRLWLSHINACEKTGTADILIEGVGSSIIEVASCLSVGFARLALGSIRAQIDLVLSWLFFKDHPVEWSRLEERGDGFLSRSDVLKYLGEKYSTKFGARFAVLKHAKVRRIEDPYSLLSAHLHKQASATVVSLASCADVVCDIRICDEVVEVQESASEYLSDVLIALFADKWAAVPEPIVRSVRARLTPAQESVVFD